MIFTVYLALFGWVPLTFLFFAFFPARRAVLLSVLGGHLFLPVAGIPISGLPDFTKISAVSVGTLMAALAFDGARVLSFRMRWFDLTMLIWCVWPCISALSVGAGLYAALSLGLAHVIQWAIPYLLGRVYFTDRESLRELVLAVCAAGLIYVPLCLFEVRMSPLLHKWVYGFNQHVFSQTRRFGGFRPQVFLNHGLAVGMFMTTVTMIVFGLWYGRARERVFHLSLGACTLILLGTTLLCKSLGSFLLLLAGISALIVTGRGRRTWPVYIVLATAPLIMVTRATGMLESQTLIDAADTFLGGTRVKSLRTRLETEDTLLTKAKARLWTGWGPGAAYRQAATGRGIVEATDGFWIISFGKYGLGALVAFVGTFVIPGVVAMRRWSRRRSAGLKDELVVPVLVIVSGVYLVDVVLNAMPNPLYVLIAGALASFSLSGTSSQATVPHPSRRL